MTLLYCATCSSPRSKQSPKTILPLKIPLPVPCLFLNLILTLTLFHLLSHFPVLVNRNFVVLPRWALWDHPKRKQTFLQTSISSPQRTRRKLLQLRCRTSHQQIANLKNCLPRKYQLTHPLLRGCIPNTFFLYDKLLRLDPGNSDVIIWKIPSVKFYSTAKVARPSSDPLIELATSFSSPIFQTQPHGYNFFIKLTLMVLDPLLASVLQFYLPCSPQTTTIFSNGPSQSSSTLAFEINWTQWTTGWRQSDLIKNQPTRSPQSQQKLESQ